MALIFLLVTNVVHLNSYSWLQGGDDKLELLDEAPGFVISRDSIVFKLIRRIRRGEIFVTGVSHNLETVGVLLSALYLYQWIVSYLMAQYCIRHIQLADYYVIYKNEADGMFILTGMALMIISQIILLGKDLKEEQDLTI